MAFDASNHSSMECSLAALWAIRPWLDGAPDTKIVLHHVHKDVGLDAHSLVHLYATSTRVVLLGALLTPRKWRLPQPCLRTGTFCSGTLSILATTFCASASGAPLSPLPHWGGTLAEGHSALQSPYCSVDACLYWACTNRGICGAVPQGVVPMHV